MKNTLNYITFILGLILFLSGIVKLIGGTISINIGNYIEGKSLIYIVIVNFICGFTLITHSVLTLNKNINVELNNNSNIIFLSALIIITHSLFRFLEIILMLSGVSFNLIDFYLTVIIISMLINLIIPSILAIKNINKLNSLKNNFTKDF